MGIVWDRYIEKEIIGVYSSCGDIYYENILQLNIT